MNESAREFIDNDGVSICIERSGTGSRNVLFAHGWISSRRMWYDVAARIDATQFTLQSFDFRGCGLSDRPAEGHDLEGYASDLRAALRSAGTDVTLVGHSMGGKLAQFVAAERPPNLRRLILVAPGSARATRFSEKHRIAALEAYGSRKRISRFQRAAMARAVQPASTERIVDDALLCQYEHWTGWYDRGRSVEFADRLAEIDVPVLVIGGGKDPLAPVARLKRDVAGAIPGALFVTLHDAGHNLPVEMPMDVAAAVKRFDQNSP